LPFHLAFDLPGENLFDGARRGGLVEPLLAKESFDGGTAVRVLPGTLGAQEQPLCFMTVGTVTMPKSARPRPAMADYTSNL